MGLSLKRTGITSAENRVLEAIRKKTSGGILLSEVLEAIFPDVRKIVPCDRLDAGLVEEDGQRIVISHSVALNPPVEVPVGYTEDVEGALLSRVFQERTTFITGDLGTVKEEKDASGLAGHLVRDGILSCIVAPLFCSGNVSGILLCGSKRVDAHTERHALLFQTVAQDMGLIAEKTCQQVLLEQTHQAYMEMLSFVSHELKSPTSSIITLGRTMADGYYGKIDEKQRDILTRIIKKAEYLHAVSDKYLNLSRLESNIMESRPQLVDFIEDVIEPAIELLIPQIDDRGMKFERTYTGTVYPVQCDPDLIRIVVLNLLGNGIRYGNKGGALRVSVEKGYKKFLVSVWNEGPGFSERDKYLLFRKFSRLRSRELADRKGSGVGLYVSWKIIHMHGGRIYAESDNATWARFTFELPQYMDLCIVE
jgi:signal transduction histidine kinase